MSNRNSFWDNRNYLLFMTEEMEEAEFVRRLRLALENEERVRPESAEKVYSGEDYELIKLVADEYVTDLQHKMDFLSFKDEREHTLESDYVPDEEVIDDSELTETEESFSEYEEELDFPEEEETIDEDAKKEKLKKARARQNQYIKENEQRAQINAAQQKQYEENAKSYDLNAANLQRAFEAGTYPTEQQQGAIDFQRQQEAYPYQTEIEQKKQEDLDRRNEEQVQEAKEVQREQTRATEKAFHEKQEAAQNYESRNQNGHISFDQGQQGAPSESESGSGAGSVSPAIGTGAPGYQPNYTSHDYQSNSNTRPVNQGMSSYSQFVGEKFHSFKENASRVANITSDIATRTGAFRASERTANQFKTFMGHQLRSGDETHDVVDAGEKVAKTGSTLYHGASALGGKMSLFAERQAAISQITHNQLKTTSGLYVRTRYNIDDITEKSVARALTSKKRLNQLEKDLGTFGLNNKQINKEIGRLLYKQKHGILTSVENDRLLNLRSGRTLKHFSKSQSLLRAHGRIIRYNAMYLMRNISFLSGDAGLFGISTVGSVVSSPYFQKTLRSAYRFSMFAGKHFVARPVAATGKYLAKHTKTGAKVEKKAQEVKQTVVGVKQGISSMKQKTIANLSDRTIGKLANTKVGKAYTKTSKLFKKTKQVVGKGVNAVTYIPRKLVAEPLKFLFELLKKLGIYAAGVVLALFLLMVIFELVGSALSVIITEESDDGRLDLSPYIAVLEDKNEEFTKKIESLKSSTASNGTTYENVELSLSNKDNTKEILSMMAVRFENELTTYHTDEQVANNECNNVLSVMGSTVGCGGHKEEVKEYIKSLYDASHQLSKSESLPYDCGETEDCTQRVGYQEKKHRYVSFNNMSGKEIEDYIRTHEIKMVIKDSHGKPTGAIETYLATKYKCPGTHIDLTISSSVLGFDEIFTVDNNGGNYGVVGANPLENGASITIPDGLGKLHTYMGWSTITSVTSDQYKLRRDAGESYDVEGFARIGDRYVIACTSTFGRVGDYVDFYQKDGTILKCIIGDIKNQEDEGCNEWGHSEGKIIVEFVVNKATWYQNNKGAHVNPGTTTCHPEWNQALTKCVNRGNYWSNPNAGAYASASEKQLLVANNAKNNVSTIECTSNYRTAWASGVYEASGLALPQGNAIDFWNKWKSSGSSSMNNIPIGAMVIGSGSSSSQNGQVGIYIGNDLVANNIGRHSIETLDNWCSWQTATCQGYTGWIGWVWPHGNSLGSGTDGSSGTSGYTGFSYWNADNIDWVKNIYEQDWNEIYSGYTEIGLDWTTAGIHKVLSETELQSLKRVMNSKVGSPYVWGAEGPNSFDCSGLVKYVYETAGLYDWKGGRPTSYSLMRQCIPISEDQASPGDLVIWDVPGNVHHVGIYCGNGIVYHAPQTGDVVKYSKLWGSYGFFRLTY